MHKLVLFLILILFIGCSSDNALNNGTNSLDDLYAPRASSVCANSKQNSSVTSATSTPMLVILINYDNVKITSEQNTWAQKIYTKSQGNLNHYFQEISQNQFEFEEATECNGISSVTLNKNHPNLNIDNSSFNTNVYPDLTLALKSLDDKISFNTYDTNGDGAIQASELLFTFIIAGYEDAYEGSHVTNGIWAHQNCIDSSIAPLLDGVKLMECSSSGNFSLFGERHNKLNPHNATIGIIAHELAHSAFNLPDLYLGGGIGNFGLMGGGTWAYASNTEYAGETPVHMSAWSKIYNNWLSVDNSTGTKIMNATSSDNYNIVKIQNGTKHYLLENRANSGYDRGLYMLNGTFNGGIAIWQIDESKITQSNLDNNTVNSDSSNQGVYMVDAQGTFISGGIGGNENALFYDNNVISFIGGDANITNIGVRGSTMDLIVN